MKKKTLYILTILVAATSCKKIIHVNLNAAAPRIVIEANMMSGGPCTVKISKTVNFDEANNFPKVSAAIVILSDNSGKSDTLKEIATGIYESRVVQGLVGKTYTLVVTTGGQTYSSTSFLPPPVGIDNLFLETSFDRDKRISVTYADPHNVVNYYRAVEIINGKELEDISVGDDQYKDGAEITQLIGNDISKYKIKSGDAVTVKLQTISKGAFDYFRTLSNILLQDGGGGPPPTSPSNPLSNFDNNALGYFNTYSETERSITIP